MKRNIIVFSALMLIVRLNCFTQILDSAIVSIKETQNANATFEKLKDCQELVSELDSQNVRLEKVIEFQNDKITDLYNVQDLHKDNFNLKSEELESCQAETKILKKEIRKQKFQKVLIIAGAMVVQGVTIYLFTHPF